MCKPGRTWDLRQLHGRLGAGPPDVPPPTAPPVRGAVQVGNHRGDSLSGVDAKAVRQNLSNNKLKIQSRKNTLS